MALEESELESTVDTDDLVGKGAENKSDELAKEDQESGLVVEESDAIVEGSDAIVDEPQASTKEKPRARTSLDPPGEEPTEPVKKRDLSVDVEKKRDLSVDVKKTRDLSVDVKKQSNLSVGVEGKSEIIHDEKRKSSLHKKTKSEGDNRRERSSPPRETKVRYEDALDETTVASYGGNSIGGTFYSEGIETAFESSILPLLVTALDGGFAMIEDSCRCFDSGPEAATLLNKRKSSKRLQKAHNTNEIASKEITLELDLSDVHENSHTSEVDDESKLTMETFTRQSDRQINSSLNKMSRNTGKTGNVDHAQRPDGFLPVGTSDGFLPVGAAMMFPHGPTTKTRKPDPPVVRNSRAPKATNYKTSSPKSFSMENPPIDPEVFGQFTRKDKLAALDMAEKLKLRAQLLREKKRMKNNFRKKEIELM